MMPAGSPLLPSLGGILQTLMPSSCTPPLQLLLCLYLSFGFTIFLAPNAFCALEGL